MSETQKLVLAIVIVGAGLFAVTRMSKKLPSPWKAIGSPQTGPSSVSSGNGWLPAFFSTAASNEPIVVGEPETGNVVADNAFTMGICAPGGMKAKGGCGCGGKRKGAPRG
jgi:hypothetical protein